MPDLSYIAAPLAGEGHFGKSLPTYDAAIMFKLCKRAEHMLDQSAMAHVCIPSLLGQCVWAFQFQSVCRKAGCQQRAVC